MPDFPVPDELNQSIVMALQLNGRASWKQVAKAVGAKESTVTRRGQQLLANRAVAITGVLDHLRCGLGISIYMRFRARPGRALHVARVVAALAAPRFVTVTIGSFDVAAEVVVKSHRDVMSVVENLERIDDVVESESMMVVRKFSAFEEWHPGHLDEGATQVLRSGGAVTDYAHRDWVEPERLTSLEIAIANVLAGDGRATYATVASRTGASESTAARRIESLVARGCLRFRAVFESPVIGYDVEFLLWLTVEPARVEEVGTALAKQPSSRYVSACTGRHNLIVQGVLASHGDLYHYSTHFIGELDGVIATDLSLLVQTLKRAWVPIDSTGRPVPQETS